MRRRNWSVPYALFLLIFVVIPLLLIVLYAFTDEEGAFTMGNFRKFLMHPEAMNTFIYSIGIAIITTIVCLVLGYPAAYILSQKQFNTSKTMVVLFILPMWVNILIRTLATVALFDFLQLPLGEGALVFGMVYNFLPFTIPLTIPGAESGRITLLKTFSGLAPKSWAASIKLWSIFCKVL